MLALFTQSQKMPEELAEFSAIITEKAQDPLALLPLTEEEQVCRIAWKNAINVLNFNSFCASGDFCCLLITFAVSLDPDQD